MGRSQTTLRSRMRREEYLEARKTIGTTEHLLALILVELMETRGHRKMAELSLKLEGAGFSKAQAAAILNTTPQSLNVAANREGKLLEMPQLDPVDPSVPQ